MNDRTIWIFRIIAIFILLLFAYLMLSLYTKLRRMREQAAIEVQVTDGGSRIADRGLRITEIKWTGRG